MRETWSLFHKLKHPKLSAGLWPLCIFVFYWQLTEAKQDQSKPVTSSLLGWKCRCALIVLLEVSDMALQWRMLDPEAMICELISLLVGWTPFGVYCLLWTLKVGICERNTAINVLELALDNVVFMSKFPYNLWNFNIKFRKKEKKVKYVNIFKREGE